MLLSNRREQLQQDWRWGWIFKVEIIRSIVLYFYYICFIKNWLIRTIFLLLFQKHAFLCTTLINFFCNPIKTANDMDDEIDMWHERWEEIVTMLLNKMLRSKVQGTQSLITSIMNKVQSDLNLVFFGKHPIEKPNVECFYSNYS